MERLSTLVDEMPETSTDDFGRVRKGSWMASRSGGRYWPLDPRIEDLRFDDMVNGLAMECRYGKQICEFYSVAEHSVIVSQFVERFAWSYYMSSGHHTIDACVHYSKIAGGYGLLHDASEAWLGDMPSPIKRQPAVSAFYKPLEEAWMSLVFTKFGLVRNETLDRIVHEVDMRVRMDEIEALCIDPDLWPRNGRYTDIKPLGAEIAALPWNQAASVFVSRFSELFPSWRETL